MDHAPTFIFHGRLYYPGTIVEIRDEYQKDFHFRTVLKFIDCVSEEGTYCFVSIYDNFEMYTLYDAQIDLYIKTILKEGLIETPNKHMSDRNIEGIVSAWMWYVLIMWFALFFQGLENTMVTWVVATLVFFSWRNKKIKGG